MPDKFLLADGTEKEVPTTDELKALQDGAQQAVTFKAEAEKLRLEKEELEKATHPDWRQMREKEKAQDKLIEQLKLQGKALTPEGTIVDAPKMVSPGDIAAEARKAAKAEVLGSHVERKLSEYDEKTRTAIKFYFDKFSHGEELNIQKIDQYFSDAEALVRPAMSRNNSAPSYGQPPRAPGDGISPEALFYASKFGHNAEALKHANDPVINL